jgi:hypothetical protein
MVVGKAAYITALRAHDVDLTASGVLVGHIRIAAVDDPFPIRGEALALGIESRLGGLVQVVPSTFMM